MAGISTEWAGPNSQEWCKKTRKFFEWR